MSPQTFRTINRDDRKAASAARSRAQAGTVLRHEVTVVASNVVDVVASAGGWLYDRRAAGWQVTVLVSDRTDERALQILGADVFDLNDGLEAITEDPDRAATVIVAADVCAANERVRRFVSTSDRRGAEVAVWGDGGLLDENLNAIAYRLSAAARAFKAHALLAAGIASDSVAGTESLLHRGVAMLAPVAR